MSLAKLDHALTLLHRRHLNGTLKGRDEVHPVHAFFSSGESLANVVSDDEVKILIASRSAKRVAAHVGQLGGTSEQIDDRHLIATVPIARLQDLADHQDVISCACDGELQTELNLAAAAIQLTTGPDTRARFFPNFTGKGVLVGILDTGIDVTHPTFGNRIVAYWDQASDERFGLDGRPLAEAAALAPDTSGHGTSVASAAAGSGAGSPNGLLVGIAPEAQIAAVKLGKDIYTSSIAAGLRWLREVANKLALPLVTNISSGTNDGGHDGTTILEQIIDQVTGAGRIVVKSAGNNGNKDLHAMTELAGLPWSAQVNAGMRSSGGSPFGVIKLSVWLSTGQRTLDLDIVDPDGIAFAAPDSSLLDEFSQAGEYSGSWHVQTNAISGDLAYSLEIRGEPDALDKFDRPWLIRARLHADASPLTLHSWILDGAGVFASNSSPASTLTMPGTADTIITVGAFTSRNEWVIQSGQTQKSSRKLGMVAPFSSRGPTRNERVLKPDLLAPGEMLEMARSDDANVKPAQIINDRYLINAGTSFAAPCVTGTIALLLQEWPDLTPQRVRELLQNSADPIVFPTNPPSSFQALLIALGLANDESGLVSESFDIQGAGRLDVRALLESAQRLLPDPNADAQPAPAPCSEVADRRGNRRLR